MTDPHLPPVDTSHPASVGAQRVLNANFLKLNVSLFLSMLNMSMFNLLPHYLELRGATQGFYGAVAGSMGISIFLVMMLFGHTADRWSRRTSVFVYSLPVILGSLVAVFAIESSLYWFFITRLLHGVYMGMGFPIMYAWVVEITPEGRNHEAVALFGVGGLTANTVGPMIAEAILTAQPDPDHPSAYLPVFITATGLMIASAAWLFTVPTTFAASNGKDERPSIRPLLKRRESQLILAITFVFGGMFGIYSNFGKNFTSSLNLRYATVLYGTYSGGAILSRLMIRPMTRLLLERNLIPVGFVGVAITFFTLALAQSYWGLSVGGLLYGFGHGVLYPALFIRFLDMQQDSEMGRATILYQGLFSVGWGFLPYAGGYLIQFFSFQLLFTLLASICGISIVLHQFAERIAISERSHDPDAAPSVPKDPAK